MATNISYNVIAKQTKKSIIMSLKSHCSLEFFFNSKHWAQKIIRLKSGIIFAGSRFAKTAGCAGCDYDTALGTIILNLGIFVNWLAE